MLLENKSALITGGSAGIGRATAIAMAKAGAKVLVSDVNAEGGAETVRLIEAEGGTASYITADVTREDEVKTMIDALIDRYGKLDIAINNAGIGGERNYFQDQRMESFDQVMNINVKGVWLCMKYEIPHLLANPDGGSIVNLSSVAGLIASPGSSPYSASKHAVIGLTKTAAVELARKNIRVNAVCPSYTETAMVTDWIADQPEMAGKLSVASPMRRLGNAEEVAAAVLWLASDQASFVNGVTLAADGGLTAM